MSSTPLPRSTRSGLYPETFSLPNFVDPREMRSTPFGCHDLRAASRAGQARSKHSLSRIGDHAKGLRNVRKSGEMVIEHPRNVPAVKSACGAWRPTFGFRPEGSIGLLLRRLCLFGVAAKSPFTRWSRLVCWPACVSSAAVPSQHRQIRPPPKRTRFPSRRWPTRRTRTPIQPSAGTNPVGKRPDSARPRGLFNLCYSGKPKES